MDQREERLLLFQRTGVLFPTPGMVAHNCPFPVIQHLLIHMQAKRSDTDKINT